MSHATVTRAELRQNIAKALQMKFFQIFSLGFTTVTSGSTTLLVNSTELNQIENYWRNGWVIMWDVDLATSYIRLITSFLAASHTLIVDRALPATPVIGDHIEIYDTFSPMLIHDAINDAIAYAGRYFPEPVTNHTLTLGRSVTGVDSYKHYDLTNLKYPVWRINSIWVADPDGTGQLFNARKGEQATTITAKAYLPITTVFVDDEYNGWYITCQHTTGGSNISSTILDTVAYDPGNPNTTGYVLYTITSDEYLIAVDDFVSIFPAYEVNPLFRLTAYRVDYAEYPNNLWIEQPPSNLVDHPLILEYETIPTSLELDTDTTTVPEKFIMHHAQAYLHEAMMNDNRSDMTRHERLALYHKQKADEYELKFPQRRSVSTQVLSSTDQHADDVGDPLGWMR